MNNSVSPVEGVNTEEISYHLDHVGILWGLRAWPLNLILIGIGVFLIIGPLLGGLPLNPVSALGGVLVLIVVSFSMTLGLYGRHIHNTAHLTITAGGVRQENPFYTLWTPWANILRIGPAEIQTGNPQGDAVAARLQAGQYALLLRDPIARQFHKADPLGELFRPLMRPDGIRQQHYLDITYFLQSSRGPVLLHDLQRYAPHLQMPPG
jgi:hypothetical protein